MFAQKKLFIIFMFSLVTISVLASKEEHSPGIAYQKVAISKFTFLGGFFATLLLLMTPVFQNISAYFYVVFFFIKSIFIAHLFNLLFYNRIVLLTESKKKHQAISFILSIIFPFILLFISTLFFRAKMGYLDSGLTKEFSNILNNSLMPAFGISLLINMIGFFIAYLFHTDKLTDLSYGLTFMGISIFLFLRNCFNLKTGFDVIILLFILLWGIRLITFLLIRIMKIGKDDRFDNMRSSFIRFSAFWLLQGISVPIILLPIILFFTSYTKNNVGGRVPSNPLCYVGVMFALCGLFIEYLADQQKYIFKKNPANKNKWIAQGLWKYSRHPNYFGEIVIWIGLYLAVVPYLTPLQALIGLIGPFYITLLLIFVSGIPLLEWRSDKKWGNQKDYKEYKKKTSILIPWVPGNYFSSLDKI